MQRGCGSPADRFVVSRILGYLSLYGACRTGYFISIIRQDYVIALVEADYTVVFFAAGGRHTPGWNWVWKAYRSLSRKYRKNLKRLVRPFHCSSGQQCSL